MKGKILLFGLGGLGRVTLEYLARLPVVGEIIVGSRNVSRGEARCNLARLTAAAQGFFPKIRFIPLDLTEIKQVAEILVQEDPDVILTTATRMTWWLPDLLPKEARRQLDQAGFGVWLPIHLDLSMRLMEAVSQANFQGNTLIGPYPDVACPVLAAIGMTPTCGVGNLAEIVPKIQLRAANLLSVGPGKVEVSLVAHHALENYTYSDHGRAPEKSARPPYYLRIMNGGVDVTSELDLTELLFSSYPIPDGPETHALTAGTTARLVSALLTEGTHRVHAPGPRGYPGGYPIVFQNGSLQISLPPDITLDEAISINTVSHPFDGINRIEPDGTVVFKPESAEVLRSLFGYSCSRLPPAEVADRATELIARFQEAAAHWGLSL